MNKIPQEFYTRPIVEEIAQELLGKYLYTNSNGQITAGMIVETEAYCGLRDKACHAHLNKRTKRTEIMYQQGGVAYVYLCYGVHHLFNIITNESDFADAVLIRAIEPKVGVDTMLERRKHQKVSSKLSSGPGTLSQALGIQTKMHNKVDLLGDNIWLSDEGIAFTKNKIIASPRVGIAYAGEDALLPWRFRVKDNPFIGKMETNYSIKNR